jgi:hypothetical protein
MLAAPILGCGLVLLLAFIGNTVLLGSNSLRRLSQGALVITDLIYFAGAIWSMKDWYQGHHSSQNAENKSKVFWSELG